MRRVISFSLRHGGDMPGSVARALFSVDADRFRHLRWPRDVRNHAFMLCHFEVWGVRSRIEFFGPVPKSQSKILNLNCATLAPWNAGFQPGAMAGDLTGLGTVLPRQRWPFPDPPPQKISPFYDLNNFGKSSKNPIPTPLATLDNDELLHREPPGIIPLK